MAELHVSASGSGSWCCSCSLAHSHSWLIETLEQNRVIVDVVSDTCASPIMSSQTVCEHESH